MNELELKLDKLITILTQPKVPANKELWTKQQCADYLHCSVPHFSRRISIKPGFPAPIDLNAGTHGTLRWVASEVQNWALGQRISA